MSKSTAKILIVDDHRLFADGLALIVQRLDGLAEVQICNNARTLIDDTKALNSFNLILVDLQMPTVDGFGFLTSLEERNIGVPVLVVSSSENRSDIERALKLGARGFIPKNAPTAEMLEGISQVLNGKRFVPEHLVGPIDWPGERTNHSDKTLGSDSAHFTQRQIQVLNLIHEGNSNNEIAQILGVSESAIKGHVSRLFKLLHAKNRTACVRTALDQGLIKV